MFPAMYGVVRDKNGKPKVDDPKQLHPYQLAMMTKAEREDLGFSDDAYAITSRGQVPITRLAGGGFEATSDLVACNFILWLGESRDEHALFKMRVRQDVKAGTKIPKSAYFKVEKGQP